MLKISIPDFEGYNELTEEFVTIKGADIQLEHSLVSISKWESKWKKPFLTNDEKTKEETIDYIKCMTLTQNVRDEVYNIIPDNVLSKIFKYMNDSMTATSINDYRNKKNNKQEIITSEIIYYWMISFNIPIEFQKWHINRLLTLIKVCNIKNNPDGNKMPIKETMAFNRSLNQARRAKMHTKG